MAKRVLLVTQYFYPENFKGNDIAFEFSQRGYKVEVLTGIPNYPEGRYTTGYGVFSRRIETINGVKVFRVFQTPRGKGFLGLSLNYCSFVLSSVLWIMFFFGFKRRYDAILFQQLSPATTCIPAVFLSKWRSIPLYTWVLDIWPDSVTSTIGPLGEKIEPTLNRLVNWMYRSSKKLLVSSKKMVDLINRGTDFSEKIVYFPNWSEDLMEMPKEAIPSLPKGYRIMMAGNIADGLGIDSLIALLEEMKNVKEVIFIFVGGGNLQFQMAEVCKQKGLSNVIFTGKQPYNKMPAYYAEADAMLLTLKPTVLPHLDATVPARLQSYMAGGKPVLAMIGAGASDLISEADCGYAVPAGDYKSLAHYIKTYVLRNKCEFALKGKNGRHYYESHFKKMDCISTLEKIMFRLS